MNVRETSDIRELFIHELAEVNGGGPVEELLERVTPAPIGLPEFAGLDNPSTMACCEEGPDGCC